MARNRLTVIGNKIWSFQVHNLSAKDVKKYEAAMDNVMMQLHQQRMQLINQIIRDLWRQTYCGNDIDTIEIKAEEGTQTAGGIFFFNGSVVQFILLTYTIGHE